MTSTRWRGNRMPLLYVVLWLTAFVSVKAQETAPVPRWKPKWAPPAILVLPGPDASSAAAVANPLIGGAVIDLDGKDLAVGYRNWDWPRVEALIEPWAKAGKKVVPRVFPPGEGSEPDVEFLGAVASRYDGDDRILFVDATPGERELTAEYINSCDAAFGVTKLLFTLAPCGPTGARAFSAAGWLCADKGFYLGQRGVTANTFRDDSQERRCFAAWENRVPLYFEIGEPRDAAEFQRALAAAQRMNVRYLALPLETALKTAPGGDSRWESALTAASKTLGDRGVIPSGVDTLLGETVLTYEISADLRELEKRFRDSEAAPRRTGQFVDYFRADTDGSIQPVAMTVPEHYDGSRPFGLVVFLHGMGPKYIAGRRLRFEGSDAKTLVNPRLDLIYAEPYGRQNTFYRDMGEADILQTFRDVMRRYNINKDRLYLMGHSMGGQGTTVFGLHYADTLAGIIPSDPPIDPTREANQPWWLAQVLTWFPQFFPQNAYNLPVRILTAESGLEGGQHDTVNRMLEAGCLDVKQPYFAGLTHGFFREVPFNSFLPELFEHTRAVYPDRVKWGANNLRYGKAYWVEIESLEHPGGFGTVDAQWQGGHLSVQTARVARLALDIQRPCDELTVDGMKLNAPGEAGRLSLVKNGGVWSRAEGPIPAASKRRGLQGPVADAFLGKFLMVYGDKADFELMRAEADGIRNPIYSQMSNDAEFPFRQAGDVIQPDIRNSNLILFGTPKSNSFIRKYAENLPIKINDEGVTVGGKNYPGAAAIFIAPNPEQPSRYVVVWTGRLINSELTPVGEQFNPLTSLPDYIIFNDKEILAAGHFDNHWSAPVEGAR